MNDATHTSLGVESAAEGRPPLATYEDLSTRTSLFLGAPDLTEEAVYEGCNRAKSISATAVVVRPSDVDLVRNWLAGSPVKLHSVAGFPGGSATTAARLYEARDLLRRGATELVVTMNLGKLLSRKFLYLESELLQLSDSCQQNSARLRLLFEVDRLQQDHVLIGVRLAKRTRANAMELCFEHTLDEREIAITRYVVHHAKGKLAVVVHAPAIPLSTALEAWEAGVEGFVTPSAESLLQAWREELARRTAEEEARRKAEISAAPVQRDAESS